MSEAAQVNIEAIAQRIAEHLSQVEGYGAGLRKLKTLLVASGLAGSGLATLIAGATAANGPMVGSGTPGWKLACVVAAILSLVGGVCAGLKEQLQVGERTIKATECLGRLGALQASMLTGSHSKSEIATEYENILKTYPDMLR